MERMAVYIVRILGRLSDALVNMVLYIGLLGLSVYTTVALIYIPPITKLLTFISDFGSIFIMLIIYATVFSHFYDLLLILCVYKIYKISPKNTFESGFRHFDCRSCNIYDKAVRWM